jgi:hypothetical protein
MWLLIAALLAVADVEATVHAAKPAVLVATIEAGCARCDWSVEGREAVMLRLTVNGRYSQHLPIVRTGSAEYQVLLGSVEAGTHRIGAAIDPEHSAREVRSETSASIRIVKLEAVFADDSRYQALAHAPFIYQRANTVGGFSDLPLFMWYETESTTSGTRYQYSVIFTNEDGGTPADRLMATWGRTTDIEYVYGVELDAQGRVRAHDYQGPKHEVLPYRAALEGRHARLWVATDNNMLLDSGTTAVRFAPAPVHFSLANVSREAVMDAHAWLYEVATQELARESKIVANAPPGDGTIPDPRRFVYLEGCGTLAGHALTFAIKVSDDWLSSDRGVPDYRIARDGCFRGAVPLPESRSVGDVTAVRVQAFERPGTPTSGPVHFTSLNTMFSLDDRFAPGPRLLRWQGAANLSAGGPPLEIPLK